MVNLLEDNNMTAMDKKIKELNKKLGRKTNTDFKGSAIQIGKDLCKNKSVLSGTIVAVGAFVFTSAGLIIAPLLGAAVAYGYSKAEEKVKA